HLDYREESLTATINQLLGDEWAVGARYRVSHAQLKDRYSDIPLNVATLGNFSPRTKTESVLHQVELSVDYNHPAGFFSRFEAFWFAQSNTGYLPDRPGDNFWQLDVFAGW